MTPAERAVDVQIADEDDVRAAIASALTRAGASLDELRQQALMGRFASERARTSWFAISHVVGRA